MVVKNSAKEIRFILKFSDLAMTLKMTFIIVVFLIAQLKVIIILTFLTNNNKCCFLVVTS